MSPLTGTNTIPLSHHLFKNIHLDIKIRKIKYSTETTIFRKKRGDIYSISILFKNNSLKFIYIFPYQHQQYKPYLKLIRNGWMSCESMFHISVYHQYFKDPVGTFGWQCILTNRVYTNIYNNSYYQLKFCIFCAIFSLVI